MAVARQVSMSVLFSIDDHLCYARIRTTNLLYIKDLMNESIPPFDDLGYIPSGIYETDEAEFSRRSGFNSYREQLLIGLKAALVSLKQAGCNRVYIGGSFITNKAEPGDIDGCFEGLYIDESVIDPIFIDSNLDAQKAKYGVEFVFGSNRAGFFQTDRYGNSKGIVVVNL